MRTELSFQGLNMLIFTFEAVYEFIPYVVIVFALILWEGLLGGAAYVNTFYKIQVNVSFFSDMIICVS